ncbi:MAG: UbiA prenyltransferase family protein [Kiritimatiellae bacterium]|nr:UbiA prenyltransferase family protein [Kiritimatiellia bacterium]
MQLPAFISVIRPRQCIKNVLVWAGLFFGLSDKHQHISLYTAIENTFYAFLAFCFVAGAVYIMNDIHDAECDRVHEEKRKRPIASGALPKWLAAIEAGVLLYLSIGFGAIVDKALLGCLMLYFVLQVLYTLWLKRVVIVDVFMIAAGFVLRVYSGAVAAGVDASNWMLVCTFSVALLLAMCKRYNELTVLGEHAVEHRRVLGEYSKELLVVLIAAVSALSVVCYSIYTLSPTTIEKLGTEQMFITIPFVTFGIFRYVYLTICKGQGGRPEKTLTQDIAIILDVILFIGVCALIMIFKG